MQFDIGGMHCAACSSRIERALGKMPGIERASVNLATAKAQIWPAEEASVISLQKEIAERIARLGFTASIAEDDDSAIQFERKKAEAEKERKKRLTRLWPMVAFTIPLLIVSMGHMAGIPMPGWLEPHEEPKNFILVQFLLTLPVVWLGRHFYKDGLTALFRASPNMDSLVAVGTGAAFLYSIVNTFLGLSGNEPVYRAMNLYYESCAVLLTMIEFGQFLEFSAKRKAGDAIGALMSLAPETALLVAGDQTQPTEVPISEVKQGDHLLIRPGSRIPADGIVIEGASAVDLSLLTGESIPVPVNVDSELVAGSLNGEGSMIMKVAGVGQNTRLARIIRLVRDAQGTKAPIARLADRASYYFVPAVMLFALLAAIAWLAFGHEPFTTALTIFVAVLVMACPCAMGLATPMSIMVGTGRGAQMGVLIKNGAALEQAGRISVLCLDKTGTLTTGKPALTQIIMTGNNALENDNISDNMLLGMAASLEGRSEHPLGLAIIEAARQKNCPFFTVLDAHISPGLGIDGDIRTDSGTRHLVIGNEAFMTAKDIEIPENIDCRLCELAEAGQTPLLLALGAEENKPYVCAILALADQLRTESRAVVQQLRKMNILPVMLTGDNARTAKAIAMKAGIDELHAGLLPAQKAEYVATLQKEGKLVGMVGDGLNDAPALALADVGIAVGAGVDVSAEAGDIVLMRGGMESVLSALALSRAVMLNIKENLGWAFGYNILGLPVAAGLLYAFGGPMLSPMIAGTAMALSSFSVVTNALRLRWFKVPGAGIS